MYFCNLVIRKKEDTKHTLQSSSMHVCTAAADWYGKTSPTVNKIWMREYGIQELEPGVALQAVPGLDE